MRGSSSPSSPHCRSQAASPAHAAASPSGAITRGCRSLTASPSMYAYSQAGHLRAIGVPSLRGERRPTPLVGTISARRRERGIRRCGSWEADGPVAGLLVSVLVSVVSVRRCPSCDRRHHGPLTSRVERPMAQLAATSKVCANRDGTRLTNRCVTDCVTTGVDCGAQTTDAGAPSRSGLAPARLPASLTRER
jgi:hypothetical protein